MNTVQQQVLTSIHEGMTVYDRQGAKVGKVSMVHPGASEYLPEGRSQMVMDVDESHLPEAVRVLFPSDRVPDVVRKRLLRTGFIRINAGLLASDRYVMPEQIEVVLSDSVYLNIDKGDTLKL